MDEEQTSAQETPQDESRQEHNIWALLLLAILIIGGLFAWTWYALKGDSKPDINSYEECVEAGYPVAESYPKQCTTPDGRTFIRQLSEEEQKRIKEAEEPADSEYTSEKGTDVIVDTPASGAAVSSPLVISGQVPGNWAFEASFPVKLLDDEGNVLAEAPAQLQGNWMTEELVPFTARLEFDDVSGNGNLVLMKDNPSGLPANDDSVSIPVMF